MVMSPWVQRQVSGDAPLKVLGSESSPMARTASSHSAALSAIRKRLKTFSGVLTLSHPGLLLSFTITWFALFQPLEGESSACQTE